jgi:phage/plasmid-like protein (TIGR03299 family)
MDILKSAFSGLQVADPKNTEAVADLLDKFGLRWDVEKQPLFLSDGTETPYKAVVRMDNLQTLQTCKDGYTPYQNSELAELLIRISEKTGYTIHSGGEFNGGGKVFLQLATGNELNDLGKNRTRVQGYVTGINGHDGTTSLKWGSVNITICCKNTFASAKKALQTSARHTSSIKDRVEISLKEMGVVAKQEKAIFDQFLKLSEIAVTKDNIVKVVKEVTGVDISTTKNDVSKYAENRAKQLTESIATEINQKGETLWGLFSGVTHYTSHVMPIPNRDNARLESKYVGSGATIDNDVLSLLLN